MTLQQKQTLFVLYMGKLLAYASKVAAARGLEVSIDEAYRPKETAELYAREGRGVTNSLHTSRLALDLNLINGSQMAEVKEYITLGQFWKALDPLCSWGGDFTRSDSRHFSISHGGMK